MGILVHKLFELSQWTLIQNLVYLTQMVLALEAFKILYIFGRILYSIEKMAPFKMSESYKKIIFLYLNIQTQSTACIILKLSPPTLLPCV